MRHLPIYLTDLELKELLHAIDSEITVQEHAENKDIIQVLKRVQKKAMDCECQRLVKKFNTSTKTK